MTCESDRLAAAAIIGGLFLVAGLAVAVAFEQFRPIIFLTFLFLCGIAPPLSAWLVYLGERGEAGPSAAFTAALVAARTVLLSFLVALISSLLVAPVVHPQPVPSWIPVVVFLTSATAILICFGRRSASASYFSARLDAGLIVAFAVAVFALSPFRPAERMPIGLVAYAFSASDFGLCLLLGIAWTAIGIWLRRHEGWAFPHKKRILESAAVAAVGLVILGLYDDGHFVDMGHYMPLVGPAIHALRGGIPMVDVYSQYGLLPWLVHSAAFELFSPTFGTAAVVIRLLNLCYFAVFLAILFFVTRRRLTALWFFVPALLVAITSHNPGSDGMWNMHALPMTLAERNLLPACMALLLVAVPAARPARWTALVLIMLASLASLETAVFTLAPWGCCVLLNAVRARSMRYLLRHVGLACAALVAAQAAFAAVVYFSTGAIVDYRPYFSLFLEFRPAEDSHWSAPFVPYYALWLPIAFAYFLVMAMASYRAFRCEAAYSLLDRLLPVAVLGLGPLAYFFGRPQEATLNISCLSFAIVAIGMAEAVFQKPRRFGPVGPVLATVLAAAFAFTIADGFEHFMRPAIPDRGNATILRRCFTDEGCRLSEVPRNISLALHTQPLDPRTKVGYSAGDGGPRIEEVTSMLRRLAPDARYVGLLTDYEPRRYADAEAAIGMAAFMATDQWFAWSISSPVNDGNSSLIVDRVLKRVATTPSGMLIIVSRQQDGWVPLNRQILNALTARCRLSLIETGQYHSAFLTEGCAGR